MRHIIIALLVAALALCSCHPKTPKQKAHDKAKATFFKAWEVYSTSKHYPSHSARLAARKELIGLAYAANIDCLPNNVRSRIFDWEQDIDDRQDMYSEPYKP